MIDIRAAKYLLELVEDADKVEPESSFTVVEVKVINEDDGREMYRARRMNGFDTWSLEEITYDDAGD